MTRKQFWILTAWAAFLAISLGQPAWAQKDAPTRTVKGQVFDESEKPLAGSIVQLKNTKTLQVKSFIANDRGEYYFHGLDPNIDYQLKAIHEGESSRTRTLSTFDDRREVVYNFTIKVQK